MNSRLKQTDSYLVSSRRKRPDLVANRHSFATFSGKPQHQLDLAARRQRGHQQRRAAALPVRYRIVVVQCGVPIENYIRQY
jgi:hypothetical protein